MLGYQTCVGLCLGVLLPVSPQCWAVYWTYPGSPGRLGGRISSISVSLPSGNFRGEGTMLYLPYCPENGQYVQYGSRQ